MIDVLRLVVLVSGRGSNLQAIIQATAAKELQAQILAVISNQPDSAALVKAKDAGIPTETLNHRDFDGREVFDLALRQRIDNYQPDLVVLAGFMRILSKAFVEHYQGRLVNIHPSLLPAFPGINTHARALEAGVKLHGATVHFVSAEVDAGPIIVQAAVPVLDEDTPDSLAARVLAQEHRIYPLALEWIRRGLIKQEAGKTRFLGKTPSDLALIAP